MKRVMSLVLCCLLLATMMLTSCSSKYSAIQKAFEDKGYEENTELDTITKGIKEEIEKDDLAVELHLLTNKTATIPHSVLIVEFKTTEDMVKLYQDSETVKGLVKDIASNEDVQKTYELLEEAGYAKGNCLCIPLSIVYANEITNIVKSVN